MPFAPSDWRGRKLEQFYPRGTPLTGGLLCQVRHVEELIPVRQRDPRIAHAFIMFALLGVGGFLRKRRAPSGRFPSSLSFGFHLTVPTSAASNTLDERGMLRSRSAKTVTHFSLFVAGGNASRRRCQPRRIKSPGTNSPVRQRKKKPRGSGAIRITGNTQLCLPGHFSLENRDGFRAPVHE
jgi:hypothetical protein